MRVLVTRPEPESDALAHTLRTLGHVPVQCPMLQIRFRDARVDLDGVQALLFTSGAGARAFAHASARRDLPVFSVGQATAPSARELGFPSVETANGDGAALVDHVAARASTESGALLHVSGAHVAGDLAASFAPRCTTARMIVPVKTPW